MSNGLFANPTAASQVANMPAPKRPIVYEDLGPLNLNEGWLLLVYGGSGVGKTWFCGTAGERTLFLNIGNGVTTIQAPLFSSLYPNAKKMLKVNITEQFAADHKVPAPEAFDRICEVIDDAMSRSEIRDRFDTIVIDDASALKWFALIKGIKVQELQGRSKRDINKYVLTDIGDKGKEIDIMNWFLREYCGMLKAAGVNLILTAHERRLYGKAPSIGEERVLKAIKPGFTGITFPDDVPGFFDEVWRFTKVGNATESWTQANTKGSESITCKTRHNGIFAATEDKPDFLKMLARIRSGQMYVAPTRK